LKPFLTATPAEMEKTVTLKTTLGSIKNQVRAWLGAQPRPQLPEN